MPPSSVISNVILLQKSYQTGPFRTTPSLQFLRHNPQFLKKCGLLSPSALPEQENRIARCITAGGTETFMPPETAVYKAEKSPAYKGRASKLTHCVYNL
jgi:hypothetical protein